MGNLGGWSIPEYWEQPRAYIHWVDAFSVEELDLLQAEAKKANSAATVGFGEEAKSIRRTNVLWLCPQNFAWAYERVALVVAKVNFHNYRYALTNMSGQIQLGNYTAKKKSKYDWHTDTGSNSMRKLSFILQLTDPEEYDGGEVQLKTGPVDTGPLPSARGDMLIFPSYTLHRVTPISRGERQSLVAWVSGPEFK